jgi:ribulose-phosphate 3-epimerase
MKEWRRNMKQLAPSILSADFICLGEQLKQLQKLCIHYLHIDVMDGMFVPSISFGMPVIASLRKHTDMFFDVHLMIEEPIRYVNALRQAGADGLTVHAEACADLPGTIATIRESGAKPAVCLSPKTPLSKLDGILDQVDMVLIMGVEPGFGGQTLIWETLEKVKQLHKIRKEQGLFFKIEIDGGVTKENARAVAACGVDIVVAGTAVFRGDIEENIHVLQEEINTEGQNAS